MSISYYVSFQDTVNNIPAILVLWLDLDFLKPLNAFTMCVYFMDGWNISLKYLIFNWVEPLKHKQWSFLHAQCVWGDLGFWKLAYDVPVIHPLLIICAKEKTAMQFTYRPNLGPLLNIRHQIWKEYGKHLWHLKKLLSCTGRAVCSRLRQASDRDLCGFSTAEVCWDFLFCDLPYEETKMCLEHDMYQDVLAI